LLFLLSSQVRIVTQERTAHLLLHVCFLFVRQQTKSHAFPPSLAFSIPAAA
jgi:hypothetical protein